VDIGMFWEIIETARVSAGQDRPFHESLTDHLATLTEQDILPRLSACCPGSTGSEQD
jgi:hypothetical protein